MLKVPASDKATSPRSPSRVQFTLPAQPPSPTKPTFKSVKSFQNTAFAYLELPYSPLSTASPFRQPTYWADLCIITPTCALAGFRTTPLWLAWGVPCVAHLSLSFGDGAPSSRPGYPARRKWILLGWLATHVIIHLGLALLDRRMSRQYSFNTLPRDAWLFLVLACAVATRLFYYYLSMEQSSPPIPVHPVPEKAKKGKRSKVEKVAQSVEAKDKAEERRWAQARRRTIMGYESRPPNSELLRNPNDALASQVPLKSPVWQPIVRLLGLGELVTDSHVGTGEVQVKSS